jgi:hypothetical protein
MYIQPQTSLSNLFSAAWFLGPFCGFRQKPTKALANKKFVTLIASAIDSICSRVGQCTNHALKCLPHVIYKGIAAG